MVIVKHSNALEDLIDISDLHSNMVIVKRAHQKTTLAPLDSFTFQYGYSKTT